MFLLTGVIIAELAGQQWTKLRRQSAKSAKSAKGKKNNQTARKSQTLK